MSELSNERIPPSATELITPEPKTTAKRGPGRPPAVHVGSPLTAAICAVMSEAQPVDKTGRHPKGYKFGQMVDVLRELAPLMGKHGLVVFQSEIKSELNPAGILRCYYQFDIKHAGSGEQHTFHRSGEMKVTGDAKGYNDKGSAAIATMVRKYALAGLFNLVIDDMPDADNSPSHYDDKPQPPAKNPMKPVEPPATKEDPLYVGLNHSLIQAATLGYEQLERAWQDMRESVWEQLPMAIKKRLVERLDSPTDGYKMIAGQVEAEWQRTGRSARTT
jgi:hypothetical protein